MSDVEQRLLRAGRELRELDFEPPPLPVVVPPSRASTPRIPALAMPVLVLLGGLAVMAGTLGRDVGTDPVAEQAVAFVATSAPPVAATSEAAVVAEAGEPDVVVESSVPMAPPAGQSGRTLTAHEEVVMIGSLAPSRIAPVAESVTVTSLRRF